MAHLHLPAQHDQNDLAIATALAAALRSADLYVTWSTKTGTPGRPVVPAALPQACGTRRRRGVLGGLLGAIGRRRSPA